MNINQRLRASAIHDLQKFCPDAHYWLREHSPQADLELTHIVLANPGSLRPTLRETDAAQALSFLAQYEIRSRAIWTVLNPVKDSNAPRLEPTEEEERQRVDGEREIAARLEVFRDHALTYARMVGDPQMIEEYQLRPTPTQTRYAGSDTGAAPDGKPWEVVAKGDPQPEQPWYTAARYFAREIIKDDATLLNKRELLAKKVGELLSKAGYRKRGGKQALGASTIKKSFTNVQLA